ncbi:WXG100 family type VII secretion target [Paenibacillus intestini]|uniref:WXG100 family type VII secretion target n=1 Tax=Paenibacillus cucumis (ex Kampfer et al. 2016) TaxID=1776858 RepID=A0ABS7KKM9_9BACL|nr:WXG100 family type VII secretion target [Paenibacillus cucumis (ex Kampfer et al. 2016)]MBY0204728.1 WXG100 family type VII secretion target [Paenibacillus cucumis (ex Kampfer et al. 2016)]MDP9702366.1 WXG100 family type VII secretion target [Paenibacillus intestini]
MTTIKVTPEQLLSVSKQFATAQSQIAQMNHILKQQLFEIERQWNGSTKERFYADFIAAQRVMDNFCSLSLSIAKTLEGHAEKFRLADQQTTQSYDANCAPPPPDECRAPTVDNRNAFQKSVDSLKELGTGFMQAADDRYQKRYDSVGGFLDYWTFGIPSGLVEGYMDRADKAFNSANDTANWLTFGIHGTIREAIFPTNAWSSEHWANMMGMGGMMVGGGLTAKMIKPHNLLTSSGGGTNVSALNRSMEAGEKVEVHRQISSDGLRNEIELTKAQKIELVDYAKKLDFPEDNIVFRDNWNTGMMYDRLYINTDVLPGASPGIGTTSANSRVSGKATLAHEIVGHYEAYLNGKAFKLYDVDPATYSRNFALDEAQASIRAARFAPDLTSIERVTLLRDAITRLRNSGLRIREVKDELFIQSR